MRNIYLPELLAVHIKNYTLYPHGLDYKHEFIKGFNLVLGGNGMGKTTFVSLIKYALIGNYKKQYEYTRTYRDNKIEKRERHPDDFFRNRKDNSIRVESDPIIILKFKVNKTTFEVTRSLINPGIENLKVDGNELIGSIISESKFEILKKKGSGSDVTNSLLSVYEREFESRANITFDDLIFFVNYILFFGEDHKTILWDEDVQKELFNTFFNSPDLNIARQEAEREAKYYDSRARHKSEDKRAIRKVLDKVEKKESNVENSLTELVKLKDSIESSNSTLIKIHAERTKNSSKISILESNKNTQTQQLDEIETERNSIINNLSFAEYRIQHRLYDSFLKNIQSNHVCPMCNSHNEQLYKKASSNQKKCWVCESEIITSESIDAGERKLIDDLNHKYTEVSNVLRGIRVEIGTLESRNSELDTNFRKLDLERRNSQIKLRQLEFESSQEKNPNELQPFYDEIEKLTKEQEEFSRISEERKLKAKEIAQLIEDTVIRNVQSFSKLFSTYAGKFLGVECLLTYEKLDNDELKKFYPIINGTVRHSEYELSESQRFFVDHSFRMSILSHFYTTPTFYIIETPDSSLDISYEKNAADVFSSFLEKPYSLILTSNLNNSSFINYILNDKSNNTSIIPLFEIAKKSIIQQNNELLNSLYISLKNG